VGTIITIIITTIIIIISSITTIRDSNLGAMTWLSVSTQDGVQNVKKGQNQLERY
jgi:uncharacterized protein YxeA